MKLLNRCLTEINKLEERILAEPEYKGKKARSALDIDLSDESNIEEDGQYFYMLNKHNLPTNLKKFQ